MDRFVHFRVSDGAGAMRYFAIVLVMALSTSPARAQRYHGYAPPFTPAWAAPQLHVDPPAGAPGTVVRIGGARFHRGVRVFYGDQPMQILERGDRYVVAVIPPYARGGDFIYVVDNTGRARTQVPFDVQPDWRYSRPRWR
jgi:hypothetical protein